MNDECTIAYYNILSGQIDVIHDILSLSAFLHSGAAAVCAMVSGAPQSGSAPILAIYD